MTLFSLCVWLIVLGLAIAVVWLSDRPGHRRRKQKPYDGPDRRADRTITDALAQPVFARPAVTVRDKIEIAPAEVVDLNVPVSDSTSDLPRSVEVDKIDLTKLKNVDTNAKIE